MSLLGELGSSIKTNLDTLESSLSTVKTELETAIGTKLDNVEFKTVNNTSVTGTGDIDLVAQSGGVLLAKHDGSFSSLKLDWSTQSKNYKTIKVFYSTSGVASCYSCYTCLRLIDGNNAMNSYYCSHERNTSCTCMITDCYLEGNHVKPFGISNYSWCYGAGQSEMTILNNKCCYWSSVLYDTAGLYGQNSNGNGMRVQGGAGGYCTCNGVNGICLTSGMSGVDAHITVIGYDPQ